MWLSEKKKKGPLKSHSSWIRKQNSRNDKRTARNFSKTSGRGVVCFTGTKLRKPAWEQTSPDKGSRGTAKPRKVHRRRQGKTNCHKPECVRQQCEATGPGPCSGEKGDESHHSLLGCSERQWRSNWGKSGSIQTSTTGGRVLPCQSLITRMIP